MIFFVIFANYWCGGYLFSVCCKPGQNCLVFASYVATLLSTNPVLLYFEKVSRIQ